MNDRVSYRAAIALQPTSLTESLPATNAALDAVDLTPLRTGAIALVGIGASLYAAVAGAAQLRSQGRRAYAFAGTDLYDASVDAADSYIAISASGRSVEPAKALALRPHAATFGIAQSADTPMAASVRTMIGTASGVDSGPNTTSYIGSLQAIGLIADRIGTPSGFDWTTLPATVAAVLSETKDAVGRAARLLAGKVALDCVGANVALGTGGYAALLIREAVRVAAQNWDTLNYLHGPMEPNDGRTGVILFGDGREIQLAQDLAGFGIASVLITTEVVADKANLVVIRTRKPGNALAEAIVQAVPAQLLIADLAEAAGLPQCIFRYRQTDTKLTAAA